MTTGRCDCEGTVSRSRDLSFPFLAPIEVRTDERNSDQMMAVKVIWSRPCQSNLAPLPRKKKLLIRVGRNNRMHLTNLHGGAQKEGQKEIFVTPTIMRLPVRFYTRDMKIQKVFACRGVFNRQNITL